MLFNSYPFLFVFLPATLAVFWLASRAGGPRLSVWLLSTASILFYGYWAPRYVVLLIASTCFNYVVGKKLTSSLLVTQRARNWTLAVGVVVNLMTLAYFKYTNFLLETLNGLVGTSFAPRAIVLPLAISFFTFTQIAYLVNAYRRPGENRGGFRDYVLFVVFFPHLLAGPIVYHDHLVPQFSPPGGLRLKHENLAVGGSIFILGLTKKTILADTFSTFATPVFTLAANGGSPNLVEAWVGALAYSLQLYFDFSGYSDMAIGLARLFGIHFPVNFDSPYKATSIADFWRRWHMTLSAFLRDYLYIPLGGNRRGELRRSLNLFVTMVLGGIWHGAGWTFVIWGALHGGYLVIQQAFSALRKRLGWPELASSRGGKLAAGALTFLAVLVGWVFFRASSVDAAGRMLAGMAGVHGVRLPEPYFDALGGTGLDALLHAWGVQVGSLALPKPLREIVFQLAVGLAIIWLLPNSGEIFDHVHPRKHGAAPATLADLYHWRPTARWAATIGVIAALSLAGVAGHQEFIYFQF